MLETYCENNDVKIIHSSAYHPQSNWACESLPKEIRKFIFEEFLKNKDSFNNEDELFKITKIHYNKLYTTTGRIQNDIRDLADKNEIDLVKQNIINTLSKKNKNIDIIKNDKNYIVDISQVKIKGKYLVKKYLKKNKKIHVAYNKVPVDILGDYNFERAIFYRNKKNPKIFAWRSLLYFSFKSIKRGWK